MIDALALLLATARSGDARALAANLGVELLELPIGAGDGRPTSELLAAVFDGREPDITEENLQARIRGNLLMALSNKFGWLVLTTGNKSEMSVGYSTLYGDMRRRLRGDQGRAQDARLPARRRARNERDGPRRRSRESIIDARRRRPSCAPTSATRTRCRPTSVLDAILEAYVEEDLGREQLDRARACPRPTSTASSALVDLAEYKRRQAPPGIKITPKAFGRDRRLPITNRYGG